MDDQNDTAVMSNQFQNKMTILGDDSIAGLLKALARYNKRHKRQVAGYRLCFYEDESGYIIDRFDDREDFNDIAECLKLLSK